MGGGERGRGGALLLLAQDSDGLAKRISSIGSTDSKQVLVAVEVCEGRFEGVKGVESIIAQSTRSVLVVRGGLMEDGTDLSACSARASASSKRSLVSAATSVFGSLPSLERRERSLSSRAARALSA